MGTGPENAVSQVERRHSDYVLGLGGHVCVVVGDEDGNHQFLKSVFNNKRHPYFLKISASSKLKKNRITNVLVSFLSVRPLVRGVDHLDPTIGGKSHDTKTGTQFFPIKEPKREIWTDKYYRSTFDTCFTHMRGKRGIKIYGKRSVVAMLNEYKNSTILMFLGLKSQQSCPAKKNIEHSDLLNLLKKIGEVKSKEGRAQMGSTNAPISGEKK